MRGGAVRRIQYELHDPVAIAKIDKDKPAMIAPRLHPSPQRDLAANVGRANRAAVIGARPRRQRRILLSFRHHPSQFRTGCGHRISLPASARNSQTAWRASAIARGRLGLGNLALRALLQVAQLHNAAREFIVADNHREARANFRRARQQRLHLALGREHLDIEVRASEIARHDRSRDALPPRPSKLSPRRAQ